jgi:iron complex outermembrane recepter protein
MRFRKAMWLSATVAGAVSHGAMAQESRPASTASAGTLEELVVTARRREEDLQKVPVAVSVVTAKEVRSLNILRAQDIGNVVSGLQVDASQGSGVSSRYSQIRFTIRGQSGSTGVVTYVNEVPNFPADVFDMAGVQVLKGPQGTLFGNVTTGGAVLLQPQLPTQEFNGFVNVRAGSFRAIDAEFGVGGPVIPDVLALRLAGVSHTSRGFTHNLFNGARGDGADSQALRFTAKLNLGQFQDVALVAYGRNADQQRLGIPIAVRGTDLSGRSLGINGLIPATVAALNNISCTPTCPTYLSVMQAALARQATLGKYSSYVNAFGQTPVTEPEGFINTASYELTDWLTVKDIFSYSQTDVTSPGHNDIDGFSLPLVDAQVSADKGPRLYTNEINVQAQPTEALHLTAGYYMEHTKQPNYTRTIVSQMGGVLGGANVGYISMAAKPESKINGLYGQADWKILPRLTITGGLRRTETDIINTAAPNIFSQCIGAAATCTAIIGAGYNLSSPTNTLPTEFLTLPGSPAGLVLGSVKDIPGAVRTELKAHKVTYAAAIAYELTDDISAYLTTRTGYKPGGFNTGAPAGYAGFGPENVKDWEAGIKTRWSFGELFTTANLAVYKDRYKDIQRTLTVADVNGRLVNVTANFAQATIKGFDLDVAARFRAFALTAYYSYTDARYDKYPNTGQFGTSPPYSTLDLTTQALSGVSKNRWGLRPSVYLRDLGLGQEVILSANVYGRTSFSSQSNNGIINPYAMLPGRTIVDLRADWNKIGGSNVGISAGVQNARNSRKLIQVNDRSRSSGSAFGFYQTPRTEYVQLNYVF